MPTIYQTCGVAVEKCGPCTGNSVRAIAFCADTTTATLLVDAIALLYSIHSFGLEDNSSELIQVLTRAGMI
jgi:hypothetical protein